MVATRSEYPVGGLKILNYDVVVERPHVRKFDDPKTTRGVYVSFSTWRGISFGARHYYGTLKEDNNPLWHAKDGVWLEMPGDTRGRGLSYAGEGLTKKELLDDLQDYVRAHRRLLDKRHLFVVRGLTPTMTGYEFVDMKVEDLPDF